MKRNIIRKNTGLNGISIERQIEVPDYDMTLLKLSTMTPYLEGRRVHKTLDHNKKENSDLTPNPNLVVKYNVEDDSESTQLYFYNTEAQVIGVNMFDKVEIDGTEISVAELDAASGTHQLSAGEHTVAYTLKNPTIIGAVQTDEGTFKVGAVFMGCNAITSVTIPNSVTSIGEAAFNGCTGLTSVTIGSSVTSIGDYAFGSCSGLPIIDNIRYADTCAVGATDKNLSTYTIKQGTRFIGNSAFNNCINLTSVTIPDSVTSIGNDAFSDCSGLTSVTIGSGVTSIGERVFVNCTSLTSITVESTIPPTLGSNDVFKNTNDCPIYVPSESVDIYKATRWWEKYASRIQAILDDGGETVKQ